MSVAVKPGQPPRRSWSGWAVANLVLLGLVVAGLLAGLAPWLGSSDGLLHLGVVKKPLIAWMFLCSGLLLPGGELLAAFARWRAHLFIQAFGFLAIPLMALALDPLWAVLGVPAAVRGGLLILACLPTTVASGVGLARIAGGDDALALCNATFGNLLGIVLTPLLLVLLIGREVSAPVADILLELGLLVLLPIAIGQALRLKLLPVIAAHRHGLALGSNLALLALVLVVLSDCVQRNQGVVTLAYVGVAAGVVLVFHLMLIAVVFTAAGAPGFTRKERVTITISATQKTVAMGVPLLSVLYHGDPALPLLMLPLVLYHAIQLFVASALAPWFAAWVSRARSDAAPGTRSG